MTHLAVSIAAPDTEAAIAALHQAAGVAGLAELRLDMMQEFDLPQLLADRPLPVIITCRPRREGGHWQGLETERLALLHQAAALGADYIDLEWDVADEAASLDRSRSRLILSRHDFATIPPDLEAIAADLWHAGADVVKVVGTAQGLASTIPILDLLATAPGPTIAIAMGASGLITRLLAFRYPHAFLSFAAAEAPSVARYLPTVTAPGQVTMGIMRNVYRVQTMAPTTALVGLVAADANLSPLIVEGNLWLAEQALDAVLVPLQPGPDEDAGDVIALLASTVPLRGLVDAIQPEPGEDRADSSLLATDLAQTMPVGSIAEALDWLLHP